LIAQEHAQEVHNKTRRHDPDRVLATPEEWEDRSDDGNPAEQIAALPEVSFTRNSNEVLLEQADDQQKHDERDVEQPRSVECPRGHV